jgi:5-formyltetrahydrofolate cyclo-ligase
VVKEDTKILSFAKWEEGMPLKKSPFGVMQPEVNDNTEWLDPDILIIPMLAFDRQGYRIGYGGGYYDATIKHLRTKKDVIAVGVAYAQQAVLFNLPVEPHDEKMDWIITTQDARCFSSQDNSKGKS